MKDYNIGTLLWESEKTTPKINEKYCIEGRNDFFGICFGRCNKTFT